MKSTIASLLLFSVLGSSEHQNTIRTDVNLVSAYFTVRDGKGKLMTGLRKEDFSVTEDGRSQTITNFAQHSDVPLNVGILLDTSTSLASTLGLEADAASGFFRTVMRKGDLGFLARYASVIEILQVPTEQADLLADKAQTITKGGRVLPPAPRPSITRPFPFPMPKRTARLYDTVGSTVGKFLKDELGRKAIVIVALADDAGSESSLRDALRTLKENDVIAFVLQVQHDQRDDDKCDLDHIFRGGENRLGRLAEETGGRVIRVEGFRKMKKAFEEVAEELHQQYSLGYRPANQNWDGAFRRLEIRAPRGLRVSVRDGYYATPRK